MTLLRILKSVNFSGAKVWEYLDLLSIEPEYWNWIVAHGEDALHLCTERTQCNRYRCFIQHDSWRREEKNESQRRRILYSVSDMRDWRNNFPVSVSILSFQFWRTKRVCRKTNWNTVIARFIFASKTRRQLVLVMMSRNCVGKFLFSSWRKFFVHAIQKEKQKWNWIQSRQYEFCKHIIIQQGK